jgi:tetratricopeptide (TPR) repeat protein
VVRALVVVAALFVVARATAAPNDRFDTAIALERSGKWDEAAAALEAFARASPTDALAADALAEAALLCDTRLYAPRRALALYALLVERYPDDRNARRAAARRAELESWLRADGDDLATFERIIGDGGAPPRPAARAEMSAFLAAHAGFPLADRGHLWLGHALEAAGDLDGAQARYDAALALHGAEASSAARARAALLLRRGRLDDAHAAYDAMGTLADPVARLAREAGLAAVRRARRGRALLYAAALFLVAFALFTLFVGYRRLWPPASELYFFAPVAILFAIVGMAKGGTAARAIALIASGAVMALWLGGAARLGLRARNASSSSLIALAIATAVAVVLVAVLAIHTSHLTDFVLDTLRDGPER